MDINTDGVKIRYNKTLHWLEAVMPDGTEIPFTTDIHIHSSIGDFVCAEIHLLVTIENIEDWEKLLTKEVIVQKTLNGDDLLKLINKK